MSDIQNSETSSPKVAIIGAGLSGISCAIALKVQLGFCDFVIYEKGNDIGGTWRDNVYPGCSSDVPIPAYTPSTELRAWKRSHAGQEEIHEYWASLTEKHNLYPHILLNSKVVSAEWDIHANQYHVVIENAVTGERRTSNFHIVISAIGVLETPRYPSINGLDLFKGKMFHSARWEKTFDLKNKRVGVIGNGTSALQFVPLITDDPTVRVTQFCRTATWIFPNVFRHEYSDFRCWTFRNLPFLMRLHRWSQFFLLESLYFMIYTNSFSRGLLSRLINWHMKNTAPKEYHDKLIPNYPFGCKRIQFDINYLESLHKSNFDLNFDGIERIVEDGIITKKGEKIPLDVLILATGFVADMYQIPITGKDKKGIQEYYREQHGPKAYLGTVVPRFPNFFLLYGPNTIFGVQSVTYSSEIQINYMLQLIKPILEKKILSLEVDAEATDVYNNMIHSKLDTSVFVQCTSWYRADGGNGKASSPFPWGGIWFWFLLRRPNWNHYLGVGVQEWVNKQRQQHKRAMLIRVSVILLFCGFIFSQLLFEGKTPWRMAIEYPLRAIGF